MFKKFLFDEAGATAIEYTLIAAAMAAVLILAMPVIETAIGTAMSTVSADISNINK